MNFMYNTFIKISIVLFILPFINCNAYSVSPSDINKQTLSPISLISSFAKNKHLIILAEKNEFKAVDPMNDIFEIYAHVDDSQILKFEVKTEHALPVKSTNYSSQRIIRSNISGSHFFKVMMEHFLNVSKIHINEIEGHWNYGTNLKIFNESKQSGKTDEEAALNTWTGKQAAIYGYTSVRVISKYSTSNNVFTDVTVRFCKERNTTLPFFNFRNTFHSLISAVRLAV
ncbi:MAG: hypothetical protein ACD_79C00105G0002 [uncultured bacterium]|nr:MAG: hypothetical protein ACD_79C00105G0002 [uncultured bacterium]